MNLLGDNENEKYKNCDLRLDFNFNLCRIDTKTRMLVILRLLNNTELEGVLVCGCGVGVECKVLRDQGNNVVGLDISRKAIKVASSNVAGVSFIVGDTTKLPFKDESFSQIVCSAVLEHIPDDKSAILEMQRTLRKGGKLAITTPRRKHSVSNSLILKEVEEKFGHVREGYTVNDIKILTRNNKLRILKVKFYWGPLHWLILKLFEMTPYAVKNALRTHSQEFNSHKTRSLNKALRTHIWNIIMFLLALVSYVDDFIPIHPSFRFGLGMLMEKV